MTIPISLQPLVYGEVDASKAAAAGAGSNPTLLIGQKLAAGTATANVPIRVSSYSQAQTAFGVGSQLSRLCYAYLAADPYAELWVVPLADNGSTKAMKTLTFTGSASAAGVLHLWVAGQPLDIEVASGTSATALGALVEAALGANEADALTLGSEFPVTAVNTGGAVAFTARNAGSLGNQIDLRVNYLEGQELPTGIAVTELVAARFVTMAGGSTDPVLTTALSNCAGLRFEFIAHPYSDATTLDAITDELVDGDAGRWGRVRMQYGTAYYAIQGTYATLSGSFASVKNQDAHATCAVAYGSPTPPWEIAGAYAGTAAQSFRANPSLHLDYKALPIVKAPHRLDRFSFAEREVLLGLGMTTLIYDSADSPMIQRAVANKVKTPAGGEDHTWIDIATNHLTSYFMRRTMARAFAFCTGKNIVDDGTILDPGVPCVTPGAIKADLVGDYIDMVGRGYVEDPATYAATLQVTRDTDDPTWVRVLVAPDYANGLHGVGLTNQFRLQYSAADRAAAA